MMQHVRSTRWQRLTLGYMWLKHITCKRNTHIEFIAIVGFTYFGANAPGEIWCAAPTSSRPACSHGVGRLWNETVSHCLRNRMSISLRHKELAQIGVDTVSSDLMLFALRLFSVKLGNIYTTPLAAWLVHHRSVEVRFFPSGAAQPTFEESAPKAHISIPTLATGSSLWAIYGWTSLSRVSPP